MSDRYRLAFTTLACPEWSWDEVLERAAAYGYAGIELRGIGPEMDLSVASAFSPRETPARRRELEAHGLAVCCVDTSTRLHEADGGGLDEARRNLELAARLGAPSIRVFGDKVPPDEPRERVLDRVVSGLGTLAGDAEETGVDVLIESHGDFSRSVDLLAVLERARHPRVGVLWDVHHPFRFYGEPIGETYGRLGARVRHTHLKDSRLLPDGAVRYCAPGDGDVPLEEVIRLLRGDGYAGWLSFEWEKRWHPELEPPDRILPRYVEAVRAAEARVPPV